MHERNLEWLCRVPPAYRTLPRRGPAGLLARSPSSAPPGQLRLQGCQAQSITKTEIYLLDGLFGEGAQSEDDLFLCHRGYCLAVNDTVEPETGSSPRRALLEDCHLRGQV
jgi:hypothetical protein